MAETSSASGTDEADWRQRAVARSLHGARSRAEQRIQRFLDAAFALMDEKGSTEFTIQEVIDRSKQSLRGFYQYFNGKDDLMLALFEETLAESVEDLRSVVDAETDPLERVRAFTLRLHEWCEPEAENRKRGRHNRRPISEFSMNLTVNHPDRVKNAMAPVTQMLRDLLDEAKAAKVITVKDTRHTAALIQQTVMYSWFGNRLIDDPRKRVSAEEAWEFCLHGLTG
jgi:AcrR family transcriptional regulator